jgi:nucleotide-binding universal stress UspA family protein
MYDKLLVPVDGSEVSMGAVKEAVELAKRLGSSVRLVYVLDAMMMAVPDPETGLVNVSELRDSFRAVGENALSGAEKLMKSAGVNVEKVLVEGDVHETVIDEAEEWGADLIVMGTHGRRGFNRLLLGSVAESVARRASCGVMLVRPKLG